MSVRPKSIIKKSSDKFYADRDIQKYGDFRMGNKVRIASTAPDVHMLIADSFGKRMNDFMGDISFMDTSEHKLPVPPHQNRNHTEIRVVNYSRGSRYLSDGLTDREISDIIDKKPKSILIMLGMVDIASQSKNTKGNNWFLDEMINVANDIKEK